MEDVKLTKKKPVRKKRPAQARGRKKRDNIAKPQPVSNVLEESRQESLSSGSSAGKSVLKSLGIELNPATARQAMVLSEVIGKPVSLRGKQR